jgi:copper(I)-binding protein
MQLQRHLCIVCAIVLGTLAAAPVFAQSVKVANAWVRAPAPGQKTAAAYFDVTSESNAALVAAGSPAADRAELHSMSMDGGVMRMRGLPRIELPAGQTVKLTPGGMHLMLIDLKQPLHAGDKVPLVLSVQSSGTSLTTVKLEAEVRAAAPESHSAH